jgi:hypothetical protein
MPAKLFETKIAHGKASTANALNQIPVHFVHAITRDSKVILQLLQLCTTQNGCLAQLAGNLA